MLPIRLPRIGGPGDGAAASPNDGPRERPARPLRYLPRRILQVMAEAATANTILGERVAPARFLVLRVAAGADEKLEQEALLADSRAAIEGEVLREARARDLRLRGALDLEVRLLIEPELDDPELLALLRALVDESEVGAVLDRLRTEKEWIGARRRHRLQIDSRPRGAAVYLDDRQLNCVTPCTLDDLPDGQHSLALSLPGHLLYEGALEIQADGRGSPQQYTVDLEREPPMGVLELITFPGQATATVNGEARETPARLRLPAGPHRIEIDRPDYAPLAYDMLLTPGPDARPSRVQLRLEYAGEDRDVPVGRLIVYKPEAAPRPRDVRPLERPEETIASFFGDSGAEMEATADHRPLTTDHRPAGLVVLGERPLYKGVLVIGRADPTATVTPDVKLFDPENTVSRGCHAWLHIYTDPGTGAEYNTFVIHSNSPGGILVDGRVIMDSVALGDESELQIGMFRMRICKETPAASVEF